jgi:NAD-reducing hydrogenase small subunit
VDQELCSLQLTRERSSLVIALGDCAAAGNVPGMRNPIGKAAVTGRAYLDLVTQNPQVPSEVVSPLTKWATPLHRECDIDLFLSGCPPDASLIYFVLSELLAGRTPALEASQRMFG